MPSRLPNDEAKHTFRDPFLPFCPLPLFALPRGVKREKCSCKRQVFDTVSRNLVVELKGHEDAVQSVLFSPADDSLVSTSSDCTFRIWS